MSNRGASLLLRDSGARGNGESALTVRFGAAGGVIGRGSQCNWVLPDPERILSKAHAAVTYKDGVFALTSLGRNGVFINGAAEPIVSGVPVPLKRGDRLRLGVHDIVVEEVLPGPAAAPSPLGAESPPVAPAPRPPLSEDWESRLSALLRPPGDPPPVIVLPSVSADAPAAPLGLADQPDEWGPEGPLRTLLLGRAPPSPEPSERYDPQPPLPPDAAFLRGIGIGLPRLGAGQAAAIAFDLGRALAALSDGLVEVSHGAEALRGNPFATLPTGPLALSELVASASYRPGQIERVVREAIAAARGGREARIDPVTPPGKRAWR